MPSVDPGPDTSRLIGNLEGRHIIVLVTDGYDEKSTVTYDDALKAVQTSGSTVFAIGVGGVAGVSSRGEQMMRRLAMATGRPLKPVPPEVAARTYAQMRQGDRENAHLHLESVKRILTREEPDFLE